MYCFHCPEHFVICFAMINTFINIMKVLTMFGYFHYKTSFISMMLLIYVSVTNKTQCVWLFSLLNILHFCYYVIDLCFSNMIVKTQCSCFVSLIYSVSCGDSPAAFLQHDVPQVSRDICFTLVVYRSS